jgi:arylsulfatase A-like enzyme
VVDFKAAFGRRDFLMLVLDALRFDVASDALAAGQTPNLERLLEGGWERRHALGTFTLPAHEAMFAGFFPTPPTPGPHSRPIAVRFAGSRTIASHTLVLEGPTLPSSYAAAGYHTLCFGGVGYFDPQSPLGGQLVRDFAETHWSRETGVTSPRAPALQFRQIAERLAKIPPGERVFLFINAAATHPPTRIFAAGASDESTETQRAALIALDRHVPELLSALRRRGGAVGIVCSDHGTCFGEDGFVGHRHAHPLVMNVPYAEVEIAP